MKSLQIPLLFLSVLVIATCGLGYELIAGTVASYLLGDSMTQFSIAIGVYLSALGIGAYLSRFIERELAARFIDIELAVALLGGASAGILMLAFAHETWFRPVLYGSILGTGTLVGLEIPLLLRILNTRMEFKELVARVLTVDYVGSLAASLLFPLLLVPHLGLMRTSLLFGLLNAVVALWSTFLLRAELRQTTGLRVRCALVIALLLTGLVLGERLTALGEDALYADEIVLARSSPYQRIVVTRGRGSFQLFLNGGLQFSSADEYRYHEALVHPPMMAAWRSLGSAPTRALVLGGGDGLAVRELLRYPELQEVVLVDLDLHKPKQANAFNLMNDTGVTSYLVGKAKLNEIIKDTPIENLQVVLTGPRTPNASELILDPMLEEMINELKTMYDYVILDTPPVGLLSDALALMKFSDLNVYVLKAGFSKKDFVDIAHTIVEKNNVKHLVFLLNNVNVKNIPAGYGGGYYK